MGQNDIITILNFDMGNIGSIQNMCKKVGIKTEITSDLQKLKNANKIIIPGVGAFDKAMDNLENLGMIDILNEKALDEKIPILGVCLGMQLLTNKSEEGVLNGLGWIKGKTKKFNLTNLNIPHMGWNEISIKKENDLVRQFFNPTRFYFVHSYYVEVNHNEDILMTTNYGGEFTSAVQKDNIYGVQFHPEKSHKFGMKLYENFGRI